MIFSCELVDEKKWLYITGKWAICSEVIIVQDSIAGKGKWKLGCKYDKFPCE